MYDISFCSIPEDRDCKRKEQCYRYVGSKTAPEGTQLSHGVFIDTYDEKLGRCAYYERLGLWKKRKK